MVSLAHFCLIKNAWWVCMACWQDQVKGEPWIKCNGTTLPSGGKRQTHHHWRNSLLCTLGMQMLNIRMFFLCKHELKLSDLSLQDCGAGRHSVSIGWVMDCGPDQFFQSQGLHLGYNVRLSRQRYRNWRRALWSHRLWRYSKVAHLSCEFTSDCCLFDSHCCFVVAVQDAGCFDRLQFTSGRAPCCQRPPLRGRIQEDWPSPQVSRRLCVQPCHQSGFCPKGRFPQPVRCNHLSTSWCFLYICQTNSLL